MTKSVSGMKAMPNYMVRREGEFFGAKLERAVAKRWAEENVRRLWLNGGRVPVDMLCPRLPAIPGMKAPFNPDAMIAINTAVQFFFGTNVGRSLAQELLGLAQEIEKQEREERQRKSPQGGNTFCSFKT